MHMNAIQIPRCPQTGLVISTSIFIPIQQILKFKKGVNTSPQITRQTTNDSGMFNLYNIILCTYLCIYIKHSRIVSNLLCDPQLCEFPLKFLNI